MEKLVKCKECGSVLNTYSEVKEERWVCEFCQQENEVTIKEELLKEQ